MEQSQAKAQVKDTVILTAFQKKVIADRPGFRLDSIQPNMSRDYRTKRTLGRYNLINLTDGKQRVSVVEWL